VNGNGMCGIAFAPVGISAQHNRGVAWCCGGDSHNCGLLARIPCIGAGAGHCQRDGSALAYVVGSRYNELRQWVNGDGDAGPRRLAAGSGRLSGGVTYTELPASAFVAVGELYHVMAEPSGDWAVSETVLPAQIE
jgi:hypothetical protein